MIPEQEIEKARNLINESKNPVFLFDDDTDGLCSFLVLRKKFGKGEGIAVKTSPRLGKDYIDKVNECHPDLVVVLDKPIIDEDFFKGIAVPILWVDHHPVVKVPKNVTYLNPRIYDKEDARPTSYEAYLIAGEKSWYALLGCIGDWYLPDFYNSFVNEYSDLLHKTNSVSEVLYNTKFGSLSLMFMLVLKGKMQDVKKNVVHLLKIDSPYELLNQTTEDARYLAEKLKKLKKEYEELLNKALEENKDSNDNFLIFIYPGNRNSYTGEIANELFHKYPDKFIIVGRDKNGEIKMSLRVSNLKLPEVIEKALVGVSGYGGGHDTASGGCVNKSDFDRFVENLREEVKEKI